MYWTQVDADIPTWELTADTNYYTEQWGLGSWAAYHGDVRIGEPGSYGSRTEAQAACELEYRREGATQHARWVAENYRMAHEADESDTVLAELSRRADAALAEELADSARGLTLGQMTPDQKKAVTDRALRTLEAELTAAAPAIARVLEEAEPRRIARADMGLGCPDCRTGNWGFNASADEDAWAGLASCANGHTWIVTA